MSGPRLPRFASGPDEWHSLTLADAVQVTDAGPARVLIKAGLVHRPGGAGLRLALQVDDEPAVILSPAAAVRVISALRHGLVDVIRDEIEL